MKKSWMIAGAVAGTLVLLALSIYGYANSTRSDGIRQEQGLSAQYKMNQNELSTYTSTIYEMLDLANLKSAKMDSILRHAVQGRYGTDGFKPNGAFFSAIQEAYPQIDLSTYDRVVTAVSSGREAFKAKQDKLADQVRAYNVWRMDGLIRSMVVGNYFPSQNLTVTLGTNTYRGAEALAKIDQMVLTGETINAFQTGEMKTLDLKNR